MSKAKSKSRRAGSEAVGCSSGGEEQVRFGYLCPSTQGCGGTVRPRVMDYVFRKGNQEYVVHDALLGICDRCEAIVIPYETQRRIDLILKHAGASL